MWRRFVAAFAALASICLMGTAAEASLSISVDLASQRMQVRTADGESYSWAISSGREGYRTIRGNFRPYRLEKRWHSRKYGGAMPNAVFFRGGFAIHGTGAVGMLGRPASHGCVRLHPANAARLFALVQKHGKGATRIAINGVAPDTGTRYAKKRGDAPVLAKKRGDSEVAAVKAKRADAQLAGKAKRGSDWTTARSRILDRGDVQPSSALGFRPVTRAGQPDAWMLRR
jgi:hypothetical protein